MARYFIIKIILKNTQNTLDGGIHCDNVNLMNEFIPHVLARLKERYPGSPWTFGDLHEIESAIRAGQVVFSAAADPGYRVYCVNYGHREPLLLLVETNHGRLITALPAEARPRWAGRAYLQQTTTKSTQGLTGQKGTTHYVA